MRGEGANPTSPTRPSFLLDDLKDAAVAGILSIIGMLLLAVVATFAAPSSDAVMPFIPAFGATCAMLFTNPGMVVSQPRVVIFSHLVGSIFGVSFANMLNHASQPWGLRAAGSLAAGSTIFVLRITNTNHPSSVATAVSAALTPFAFKEDDRGYMFLIGTALLGSVILIIVAVLGNNMVPWRSPYPKFW